GLVRGQPISVEDFLCFPAYNNSCKKTLRPELEATLIYCLLSTITILSVVLNLLVIISIYHFRQLQTCTNLLLLSLAVSDFHVSSVQMPFQIFHYRGCWFLGDLACVVYYYSGFLAVSASVGNMVLISIDRYVAICDPLFYPTKITIRRVKGCIGLCWLFSTVHASWILREMLRQPDMYNTCYGECVVLVPNEIEAMFDLVGTFIAPIGLITVLYLRVFVVAVTQARAMRSQVTSKSMQCSRAKKSELKAARTLGVVIVMFIICSCPYYIFTLLNDSGVTDSSGAAELWLIYLNSCVNPIIYAFCYPWFRRATKHIFTLNILQPGSSEMNILWRSLELS
uniref:G-protein coupled receptors family 1 profile domain-containing protein n=1 Tax=Neogobius melanostomus TaxID=47308 RepID=A0A8C6TP24_9GOBI